MSVGRNELCPCGSGKKYKKCCGVVTPLSQFRSMREEKLRKEFGGWMEKLNRFVTSSISRETIEEGAGVFARAVGVSRDEILRPEWITHYLHWYIFDHAAEGTGVLKRFLHQHGRRMEEDLRHAFQNLYLGIYEIMQIDKDQDQLQVRDLVTGEERYITGFSGIQPEPGDLLAGRLISFGLRSRVLSGSMLIKSHVKPAIQHWLETHPAFREVAVRPELRAAFSTDLYRVIVQSPGVNQREGDQLVRQTYRVFSLEDVNKRLESHGSFELKKRDGSQEIWVYAESKEEQLFPELNHALLELYEVQGEVLIQQDALVIEALKSRCSEIAEALQLPAASEEVVIEKLASTGTRLTPGTLFITSQPALPPKVLQWAVRTYFTRKWLRTPHPGLQGYPPLLAAASSQQEVRGSLIALVEHMEEEAKLGQGMSRFIRVDALRPLLALPNQQTHVANLLTRSLIEGIPESEYTVQPERLQEITRFVSEMTEGKSEATVKKYDEVMNLFRSFVRKAFGPQFDWQQLRPEEIAYFLVQDVAQQVDHLTKTLAANLLSVLASFFKWLDKQHGTALVPSMQPVLTALKDLPEIYRVNAQLIKEGNDHPARETNPPRQVTEEHLVLVEQKPEGWLVRRNDGQHLLLSLPEEVAQSLQVNGLIAGLFGTADEKLWQLYGTARLYPPLIAQMLGVKMTVLA